MPMLATSSPKSTFIFFTAVGFENVARGVHNTRMHATSFSCAARSFFKVNDFDFPRCRLGVCSLSLGMKAVFCFGKIVGLGADA